MARYVAKNIVAAGLADRCEVQLAYAIGVAEPVSVLVDTFGTGTVDEDKLEALAGLRPGLLKDLAKHPEMKILDGQFTAVQQAVGCNKPAAEGARYIAEFVEKAKKSGLVASLIEKHKVIGLSVAPPA